MRLSLLFFLLSPALLFAQIDVFTGMEKANYTGKNIALFYPEQGQALQQFHKVELGMEIPYQLQQKIENFLFEKRVVDSLKRNPFLQWSVSCMALFTHKESGLKKKVDGFYYRDFDRDKTKNTWSDLGGDYRFRFRFAPPLAGEWTAEITLYDQNKLVFQSSPFALQVEPSDHPGFVKVHPNTRNFTRGEKMIYPVGANIFAPYVENNLLYNGNPKTTLDVKAWELYHKTVQEYANQGGKFLRFLMEPGSAEIEFEKIGNYYDRLDNAWEIDRLIQTCEDKDLLLEFNMMIQSPFKVFDREFNAWDFGVSKGDIMPPYAYKDAFGLTLPSEVITQELPFAYLKQRYRYMFARWGYSPNIYLFELMSEPFWMNQDDRTGITPYDADEGNSLSRQGVAAFHHKMSDYIKDSLGHTEHLLGANGHMPVLGNPYYSNHTPVDNDNSWEAKNIDVITINEYRANPSHLIINDNNSLTKRIAILQEHYKKPVFFSETQTNEIFSHCSEHKLIPLDVYSTCFIGLAGFNIWETYSFPSPSNPRTLDDRLNWRYVIAAQNRMNDSIALKNLAKEKGNWTEQEGRLDMRSSSSKNPKIEKGLSYHFYVSADKKRVDGLIINKTFNVVTMSQDPNSPCTIEKGGLLGNQTALDELANAQGKQKKIKITDLLNRHKYEVIWYNPTTKTEIQRDIVRASWLGKIKIRPLEIRVIGPNPNPMLGVSLEQKEK